MQSQIDAEAELKAAFQSMTVQIVVAICIAVAAGAILGICCTRLVGKCYNRSQKRRLEKA